MANRTLGQRESYEILRGQLENERSSFLTHWRDCGDYILPRRPRFTVTDVNKGDRRNQKIIDSTASLAARTLRSGMMGGVTSPARPWFRLTTPDPDLAEFEDVKQWLHAVSKRMETVFLRSNLYNALPIHYGDMGTFGTAGMFMEEDYDSVVRFFPIPIGSFCIGNDARGRVAVFEREFAMTVRQIVEKFGMDQETGKINWDNISINVKNLWDQGAKESWIQVCHFVTPNDEYDPKKISSKYKKFRSVYYERGLSMQSQPYQPDEKVLSDKGYDFFPALCSRWEVTGEDVYGTDCPGMSALGDVKALQLMHKRKAQAIEKKVYPPMVAPTSMKNQKASLLSGDVTYVDVREGQNGFRAAHEIDLRLQELLLDIQDHQQRVRRAFFEDLFLMLSTSDRREITAREIDERHEEKLLALGPVLEQLNQDLLDPLIDNTFAIMAKRGMIPRPPDELQGTDLRVEYISVMAQAQKLIGLAGVERFASFASQVAAIQPSVLDKVDTDKLIDLYGDLTSIPPGIIRAQDGVDEIRAERAKMAQSQQAAESLKNTTQAAGNLGKIPMDEDNALTRMVDQANAGSLVQ